MTRRQLRQTLVHRVPLVYVGCLCCHLRRRRVVLGLALDHLHPIEALLIAWRVHETVALRDCVTVGRPLLQLLFTWRVVLHVGLIGVFAELLQLLQDFLLLFNRFRLLDAVAVLRSFGLLDLEVVADAEVQL